jgi:hypothetical protein
MAYSPIIFQHIVNEDEKDYLVNVSKRFNERHLDLSSKRNSNLKS